jgi:hypothetical protein
VKDRLSRDNGITVPDAPLTPENYYLENGFIVFTAAYHLKRGTCCGSGCRHCPWNHESVPTDQCPPDDADTAGGA